MIEAYLDIETTGLSPDSSKITVIGIHLLENQTERFVQLVGDNITPENLLKALEGVGARRLLGRKHLQRHGSPQLGVDGAIDAAHAAAADVFDQIEVPDPVTRHHSAFKDSGNRVRSGGRGNRRRTGNDCQIVAQRLAGPARGARRAIGAHRLAFALRWRRFGLSSVGSGIVHQVVVE